MPIKGEKLVDLNLGSPFATKLGLVDIDEWDATTATTASESSVDETSDAPKDGDEAGGSNKKKSKNKKKKKR